MPPNLCDNPQNVMPGRKVFCYPYSKDEKCEEQRSEATQPELVNVRIGI